MLRILRDLMVFGVVIAIGWLAWDYDLKNRLTGNTPSHQQIIMYTVEDCLNCVTRARELRAAGLLYSEVRVDRDDYMLEQMHEKLRASGYRRRMIEFPILDVHGTMLANNPPMQRIRAHLH